MSSLPIVIATSMALLTLGSVAGFLTYVVVRYSGIVSRVFEEKPMFLPFRAPRVEGGEDVTFMTRDRLRLAGTYLKARTPRRLGVLVFCHEYLSDRWSAIAYADHFRDQGYDLFCFDFRNHGQSQSDPDYTSSLQWVTEHEVHDLRGALAYLRARPDADPAGVGLFGVSRGGGTALCVAAGDPGVWGLITDGAFPTRGMMMFFITRWAEIYVGNAHFWKLMPRALFEFLCWTSRLRTQFKLKCRYPDVERATARLAPRPWMMIHGQKDAYISVVVAKDLFARAGDPKDLWIVPGAKHNRCREKDPALYAARVSAFIAEHGPRRPLPAGEPAPVVPEAPAHAFDAIPVPSSGLGMPVVG